MVAALAVETLNVVNMTTEATSVAAVAAVHAIVGTGFSLLAILLLGAVTAALIAAALMAGIDWVLYKLRAVAEHSLRPPAATDSHMPS